MEENKKKEKSEKENEEGKLHDGKNKACNQKEVSNDSQKLINTYSTLETFVTIFSPPKIPIKLAAFHKTK